MTADHLSRRSFLRAGAAVLGSTGIAGAQSGQVVFNGAGGSWQENARRAWLEPFSAQTAVRVTDTFPFDLGKLSAMVRTRAVEWDVTDCPSAFIGPATRNNLLEPIDYGIVDRNTLPADNFGEHVVAYGSFSSNIVYDRRRVPGPEAPQSWRDFFDLRRFPGPRSIRRQPLAALEAALLADGVPPAGLYPLDLDRAFRKLDTIKSEVRWWTQAQQSVQLIANGEVTMGITFPSRAFAATAQGVPLEVVWNEGLLAKVRFAVPRGAPNKQNAMRLINFIIQPTQQARFAMLNRSAPVNPAAFANIDATVAAELASAPAIRDKLVPLDELGYWLANSEAVTRRFEAWLVA